MVIKEIDMIELKNDQLSFSFPDVHPSAKLNITFQRTLRIPDDDKTYPLPPGLGAFPLRHVDDFAEAVPVNWLEHGGVMLPMYQSEAMWLLFSSTFDPERSVQYPCAIKVATGKIDAVTGKDWSNGLHRGPQDYMVAPRQPWLDGYCVKKGVIRQFVAMPLGQGYTAEEQVTGAAEHGGLQIAVYPMKRDVFERRFPIKENEYVLNGFAPRVRRKLSPAPACAAPMGLAPGGRMKQEIFKDPYNFSDWDLTQSGRCFVHIANSLAWREITKQTPPNLPPSAADYTRHGLPWFDYYDDSLNVVEGGSILGKLKSVLGIAKEKRATPLPENESCHPKQVVKLGSTRKGNEVREGSF
jgi:hypothetical protein